MGNRWRYFCNDEVAKFCKSVKVRRGIVRSGETYKVVGPGNPLNVVALFYSDLKCVFWHNFCTCLKAYND